MIHALDGLDMFGGPKPYPFQLLVVQLRSHGCLPWSKLMPKAIMYPTKRLAGGCRFIFKPLLESFRPPGPTSPLGRRPWIN